MDKHGEGETMTPSDYQDFRNWLARTYDMKYSADKAVDYLFSFNRFVKKKYGYETILDVIKARSFDTIYMLRHHYYYRRYKDLIHVRDTMLRLYFEYCGVPYDDYIQYEAEKTLGGAKNRNTLFIHGGNIACLRYNHPIEDIAAQISVGNDRPVRVHATFCRKCGIAFINKAFYLDLRKRFPFLVANLRELDSDGYSVANGSKMAAESPLKLCGYSVGYKSLPDTTRQCLLADIVYNGILTRTEIEEYLIHFISFNGQKEGMYFAVNDWENDLRYIRNLDLDQLRTVSITDVLPYSSHGQSFRKSELIEIFPEKESYVSRKNLISNNGLDTVIDGTRVWATIKETKKETRLIVDVNKRPIQQAILGKHIGDEVDLGVGVTYIINYIEKLDA